MENKSAQIVKKQFSEDLLEGLRKRKMLANLLGVPEAQIIASEQQPNRVDSFQEIPTAQGMMSDVGQADYMSAPSLPLVRKPMYDVLIKELMERNK